MKRLAIVGLGLIGGSLALSLRERRFAEHVIGVDVARVIERPEAHSAVNELIDIENASAVRSALQRAELTVLAAPVSAIRALLPIALEHCQLVTDCGSTKRVLVEAARASTHPERFVPGHPMAGGAEGGLEHARANLFEGHSWILCAPEQSPESERIARLVRAVGATPVYLTPELHDAAVAVTSHLPQLLASALTVLGERRGARVAAGPGFASATRVAGGPETMWRDIFSSNADEVAGVLRELASGLNEVADGLQADPPNPEPALSLLREARRLRN